MWCEVPIFLQNHVHSRQSVHGFPSRRSLHRIEQLQRRFRPSDAKTPNFVQNRTGLWTPRASARSDLRQACAATRHTWHSPLRSLHFVRGDVLCGGPVQRRVRFSFDVDVVGSYSSDDRRLWRHRSQDWHWPFHRVYRGLHGNGFVRSLRRYPSRRLSRSLQAKSALSIAAGAAAAAAAAAQPAPARAQFTGRESRPRQSTYASWSGGLLRALWLLRCSFGHRRHSSSCRWSTEPRGTRSRGSACSFPR
mmetsp:Transcript_20483/g.44638  ORF Transcript_20483/g.44638 Transcript_20483/m.44638 type:complete len:249 (+) Transcript_20483:285-1031(+)